MRELDFYIKKLQDLEYRGEWKEIYHHSYEKVHPLIYNSHFLKKNVYIEQLEKLNEELLDLPFSPNDEEKLAFRKAQKHIIDLLYQIRTENKAIFIAHGEGSPMADKIALFLGRLKLDFNLLDSNDSAWKSPKEFKKMAKEYDFAIILFSADNLINSSQDNAEKKYLVNQTVAFQAGYFLSHVGMKNLIVLYPEDKFIESPFNIDEIKNTPFDSKGSWKTFLTETLRGAGIYIDKELEKKI